MECVNTSGKRKAAIARAVVKEGTGKVTINKIPVEIYTPELAKLKIMEPLIRQTRSTSPSTLTVEESWVRQQQSELQSPADL